MKEVARNKNSATFKVFKAIKFILNEGRDIWHESAPAFGALMSRKTLGQVMSAMPGNPYSKPGRRPNYSRVFNGFKKKGLIKFSDDDSFTLTEKGAGVLLKFDIDDIKLADFDARKWDNIWRVLIFDIPEPTRAIRNLFRAKLQEFGFYTLQKSVYVTPRPCEKEMAELARALNISDKILILEAKKLGQKELAIKAFFGLF